MRTLLLLAIASTVLAQPPVTLDQAVRTALDRYPAIRASQEQINAAAAGITLARTAYLPRIEALAQANRATRNNVFGLLLPQSVIPSISGPVIGANNLGTVWGSAIGGLVTWEPFDFGQRRAGIAIADAARAQSEASLKRTRFDVAVATADAWVTLAAAHETVRAAQAGVDRAETVARTITAQVNAQLRPGADQSRAEAELAAARTQLIQAGQAVDVARANLAQFIGGDPGQITIAAEALHRAPPEHSPAPADSAKNPILLEQAAAIDQARAQLHALERSYFPRFYLQGAPTPAVPAPRPMGRASAMSMASPPPRRTSPSASPYPSLSQISPRFAHARLPNLRPSAPSLPAPTRLRSSCARSGTWRSRVWTVPAALPQVGAARAATQQATARYQAGLGNINEVAEAQRLLTQAEIDDALARLTIWRGLLGIAAAAGDIEPFLAEVGR